jgi:plastocyanin
MAFLTMKSATLLPRTNCTDTGVFACLLLLVMLPAPSVSLAQSVTATGRVELTGAPSPRTADLSDAVVWLNRFGDATEIQAPRSQRRLRLVQKSKSFSPHVLVVQVGEPVEFPNSDPFFHNVFSLFEGKRFDLGLYEAGTSRTVVFDRPGISYIFCNIHPEMSAVVVALRTPYYGISDRKGVITISNMPRGRYEMHVWDERALPEDLSALTRTLEISESAHTLGVLRLAEQRSALLSHKNKYGQDYENPTPNLPVYAHP